MSRRLKIAGILVAVIAAALVGGPWVYINFIREPAAESYPSGTWGEPHDALWQRLGWQPSPQQLAQFEALQEELRRWNARVNLTRLVEGADFWIAQVFDRMLAD